MSGGGGRNFFSGNNNMPGGWAINSDTDLRDVSLPPNASQSREVADAGGPNDVAAQHYGAVCLAIQLHCKRCTQCNDANETANLCATGRALMSEFTTAKSQAGIL